MSRPVYELTAADVGRAVVRAFGRSWPVAEFIGRVLPSDVGKRVVLVAPDLVQVENDAQRAGRQLLAMAQAINRDAPPVAEVPFALTSEPARRRGVQLEFPEPDDRAWSRDEVYDEEAERDRNAGGKE